MCSQLIKSIRVHIICHHSDIHSCLICHGHILQKHEGAQDAGPATDDKAINAAQNVWKLTIPSRDKWQARIFGKLLEGDMAGHNHAKRC